ncbi:hypothetical protein EVB87_046 [Rhizobium phage RHph_N28_1]|nr:hypothetical protein EVB87_046 [Rhizobium phage RHph_N28_1]QIG74074.1 hypothetical protein EVC07_046 [Rhizobium phage RHph_N42]QXV73734.1 hypothetical protein [Rhizobium phage RHph_N46]
MKTTSWEKLPLNVILFTYVDPDTGKNTTLNVTGIAKDRRTRARPIIQVPIDPEWAEKSLTLRGIEQHRLERLLTVDEIEPVLFAFWFGGFHVLIEGNHRYVSRWMRGETHIASKVVPMSVWQDYIVTGFNDETAIRLAKSFSGLP